MDSFKLQARVLSEKNDELEEILSQSNNNTRSYNNKPGSQVNLGRHDEFTMSRQQPLQPDAHTGPKKRYQSMVQVQSSLQGTACGTEHQRDLTFSPNASMKCSSNHIDAFTCNLKSFDDTRDFHSSKQQSLAQPLLATQLTLNKPALEKSSSLDSLANPPIREEEFEETPKVELLSIKCKGVTFSNNAGKPAAPQKDDLPLGLLKKPTISKEEYDREQERLYGGSGLE